MLANKVLLPDVQPVANAANEMNVKPSSTAESNNNNNKSNNAYSSSVNNRNNDFQQVIQQRKNEQRQQAQQTQKENHLASEKQADKIKNNASEQRINAEQKNNADEREERIAKQHALNDKSNESARSSNENDEQALSTEDNQHSQSEHDCEHNNEHQLTDHSTDENQSSEKSVEAMLNDVSEQVTNDNDDSKLDELFSNSSKNEDKQDTRWLDTVIDIVTGANAKSESQEQQDKNESNDALVKALQGNDNSKQGSESDKSLEQLIAELAAKKDHASQVDASADTKNSDGSELNKNGEFNNETDVLTRSQKENLETDQQQRFLDSSNDSDDNTELKQEMDDKNKQALNTLENDLLNTTSKKNQQLTEESINAIKSTADKASANATQTQREQGGNSELKSIVQAQLLQSQIAQRQSETVQNTDNEVQDTKTKAIDFGASSVLNIAGNKQLNGSLTSDYLVKQPNVASGETSDVNALLSESELVSRNTEQKLMDSLISKTSENQPISTTNMEPKTEKVEVAGVFVDKTLQAPKLESVANSKTDVLIRENILFNKQELANQMQQQVGMMMARNMKSVDIRLDPPEMGSIQVRLAIQNEQAAVSFVVSNQQTKDALEASIPKLREMLEEQGVELADSSVEQDNSRQQDEMADGEENDKNMLNNHSDQVDEERDFDAMEAQVRAKINSPWNVSYYA